MRRTERPRRSGVYWRRSNGLDSSAREQGQTGMLMEEGLPGPLQRLHWRSRCRGAQVSLRDAGQGQGLDALLNPSDGELHRQLKVFVVLESIDAARGLVERLLRRGGGLIRGGRAQRRARCRHQKRSTRLKILY